MIQDIKAQVAPVSCEKRVTKLHASEKVICIYMKKERKARLQLTCVCRPRLEWTIADTRNVELEKQKKESKNKNIKITKEINEFIVKNKDEKEKLQRKIEYLTNVLENLKKTQKNDFEKLNDEKNRLSKEIKDKNEYFSEEQKKFNKEKNEFLSQIREKTLKITKILKKKRIIQTKN